MIPSLPLHNLSLNTWTYQNTNHVLWVLFIEYSSAFHPIKLDLLLSKMQQLDINPYLIHWNHSFLIRRQQLVRVNKTHSPPWSQRAVEDVWAHHSFSQSIPTITPSVPLTNTSLSFRMIRHWWPWWQRRCSLTSTMRVWRDWSNGESKKPSQWIPSKQRRSFWHSSTHTCSSHNSWHIHKTVSILQIVRDICG